MKHIITFIAVLCFGVLSGQTTAIPDVYFELALIDLGYDIITNGTDTHIVLMDLTSKLISGKKAENRLEKCLITTNKNMIPYDERSPLITSGIRIGTPAITTRGMGHSEMNVIAIWIDKIINSIEDDIIINKVKNEVSDLCQQYPLLYKDF